MVFEEDAGTERRGDVEFLIVDIEFCVGREFESGVLSVQRVLEVNVGRVSRLQSVAK